MAASGFQFANCETLPEGYIPQLDISFVHHFSHSILIIPYFAGKKWGLPWYCWLEICPFYLQDLGY